ncbi:MAG: T9SS type A sorting domain-containing protein [Agriterribacter sp.]
MKLNSSYYEIERSRDAVLFTRAGSVPSKNNSNGFEYSVSLGRLLDGINYFRIKVRNASGRTLISKQSSEKSVQTIITDKLPRGVYFVQLIEKSGHITLRKIIKL